MPNSTAGRHNNTAVAKVASFDCWNSSRRDQPAETPVRYDRVVVTARRAAGHRAAGGDRVALHDLETPLENNGNRRGADSNRPDRTGNDRMALAVAACRSQLLVAQCDGSPAGVR